MQVVQEEELADIDLTALEGRMKHIILAMTRLAEKSQFIRIPVLNREYESCRNAYHQKKGMHENIADNWDMARNKIITYWNYVREGYTPKSALLQTARELAGITKAA